MDEIVKFLQNEAVQGLIADILGWCAFTIMERYKKKKNQPVVLRKPEVEEKVSIQFTYSKTVSHKKNEK